MTYAELQTATREQLAKWYEDNIGYNPVKDNPSCTDEELRQDCLELHNELCEGIDDDDGMCTFVLPFDL